MHSIEHKNYPVNEIQEIIRIFRQKAYLEAKMLDISDTKSLAHILSSQLKSEKFSAYVSTRKKPIVDGRDTGTTYWIIVNNHIAIWVYNQKLNNLLEKKLPLTSMALGFFKIDPIDSAMLVNFGKTTHGSDVIYEKIR